MVTSPKTPEPVRLPPKNEIVESLKDFVKDRTDQGWADFKEFLNKLPTQATRKDYLAHWVERTLTTVRCAPEREALGEIFLRAEKQKFFTERDLVDIIDQRLKIFAENGLIEDNPRLFSIWAQVISKAQNETGGPHPVLGMEMHSMFLKHLVATQRPVEEIVKFITTVWDDSASRIFECQSKTAKRFRLLPQVLRYEMPEEDEEAMFEAQKEAAAKAKAAAAEGEDEEAQTAAYDDVPQDLLETLVGLEHEAQIEARTFQMLIEDAPVNKFDQMIKRHPQRSELGLATAAVSAIFTFVRFDLERLDGLREVFKSLVRAHRENATGELGIALLSECYATWRELESTPEESLGFMVNWLLTQRFIQPRSVDEFKASIPRDVWAKIEPQLENMKR